VELVRYFPTINSANNATVPASDVWVAVAYIWT